MPRLLENQIILITGASGEIGSATVLEFVKEGVSSLILQYNRSSARVDELVKKVEGQGCRALAAQADISNPRDARQLVEGALKEFNRLDAVVCLAGHPFNPEDWFNNFEDLTPEQLKKPLDVDLLGSMYVVQAAIPEMKKRRKGRIVFIGSTPALTGDTVGISYLTAKAGLLALTRSLAQYLGPYNIHVNALALGAIDTKATVGHLTPEDRKELSNEAALKRMGTPVEVAQKIVFLCSGQSDFLTGQTLVVDGGYAMR